MCQRDLYYFNETFAQPVMRTGTVVLYEMGFVGQELAGHFNDVGGYSANGENVGYDAESCETARLFIKTWTPRLWNSVMKCYVHLFPG